MYIYIYIDTHIYIYIYIYTYIYVAALVACLFNFLELVADIIRPQLQYVKGKRDLGGLVSNVQEF
jgi:hypothetical protein